MGEIRRMIAETHEWRLFHRARYQNGVKGAAIEASACAIREKALRDALAAAQRDMEGGR
jgi:hypothetical protein